MPPRMWGGGKNLKPRSSGDEVWKPGRTASRGPSCADVTTPAHRRSNPLTMKDVTSQVYWSGVNRKSPEKMITGAAFQYGRLFGKPRKKSERGKGSHLTFATLEKRVFT